MISGSLAPLRALFPAFGLAFGLGWSGLASAAQCRVDVVGPERATWLTAVENLDAELGGDAWSSQCAVVVVVADAGLARLTFVARDGRSAERHIEDPVELVPTIQALSVEVPPSAPPTPVAASEPRAQHATPSADRTAANAPPAARPYGLHPLFGGQLGFRYGADHLISPCVGVFGAVPVDRWELGVLGRYEAHYVNALGGNEGAPETSSVVFGVSAGRREAVGKVGMRGGVTGLLAALHEDQGGKSGQAEARVGAYFGGVWPEKGRIGVRADLAAEVVPYNIGRSQSNATGSYSLPWWGLTSTLGIELR